MTEEIKPEWWVEPYRDTVHQGCLNCPSIERLASMDMTIAVGFGSACVSKDGLIVYGEFMEDCRAGEEDRDPQYWTVQDAENAALKDPDHDWRIVKYAPLRDAMWQRHGPGEWALIKSGKGFA